MKENRLFAVMTVLAISASSVFGQFKIYNSELLKIGNVNEQAKITRGFEVSMPEVLMQAGNTGIRFAEGKSGTAGFGIRANFLTAMELCLWKIYHRACTWCGLYGKVMA